MVKWDKKEPEKAQDKKEDPIQEKKEDPKPEPKPTQKPIDSEKTLDAIAEEKAGILAIKNQDPSLPTYALQWMIKNALSQYKGKNKRPKKCPKCQGSKLEVEWMENKATCKACGNIFLAGACASFTLIGEVARYVRKYLEIHPDRLL